MARKAKSQRSNPAPAAKRWHREARRFQGCELAGKSTGARPAAGARGIGAGLMASGAGSGGALSLDMAFASAGVTARGRGTLVEPAGGTFADGVSPAGGGACGLSP